MAVRPCFLGLRFEDHPDCHFGFWSNCNPSRSRAFRLNLGSRNRCLRVINFSCLDHIQFPLACEHPAGASSRAMLPEKSIEPLSFVQIGFFLENWPDENDLEGRPQQVIQAWRATPGTEVTRLVHGLHEDEPCHYSMSDTAPFRKDQNLQALIAHQVPIPGSDVLPLTMVELRSVATTYGDTASEISVRDSAS